MLTSDDKVGGWVKKGQNHDGVVLEWSPTIHLNKGVFLKSGHKIKLNLLIIILLELDKPKKMKTIKQTRTNFPTNNMFMICFHEFQICNSTKFFQEKMSPFLL